MYAHGLGLRAFYCRCSCPPGSLEVEPKRRLSDASMRRLTVGVALAAEVERDTSSDSLIDH